MIRKNQGPMARPAPKSKAVGKPMVSGPSASRNMKPVAFKKGGMVKGKKK